MTHRRLLCIGPVLRDDDPPARKSTVAALRTCMLTGRSPDCGATLELDAPPAPGTIVLQGTFRHETHCPVVAP